MIVLEVKEKVDPKTGSRSLTSAGVTVSGVKWTGVAGITFHCHTVRCTCNKDCNNIEIWTGRRSRGCATLHLEHTG